MSDKPAATLDLAALAEQIRLWGRELGFQQIGITDTHLQKESVELQQWLVKGHHGEMAWMQERAELRADPTILFPGTVRIISARMDYLPGDTRQIEVLKNPAQAYISRYALGRDYHKLIRKRLQQLATKINEACDNRLGQRPFVDSAPVLERALAAKAGLGWTGKNTMLIHPKAGSWFFLGEIYTSLALPVDTDVVADHCGACEACLKVCPTDAFTGPYELDARRCISYLTIEFAGVIPVKFREPMGNRVFGCDDCQAICPWNKYARPTDEKDFLPRHNLDQASLLSLFMWDEPTFLEKTEGSPIRRIGYHRWLRNLSIGLGNAPTDPSIITALQDRLNHLDSTENALVLREHYQWALHQQLHPGRRKRKLKRH